MFELKLKAYVFIFKNHFLKLSECVSAFVKWEYLLSKVIVGNTGKNLKCLAIMPTNGWIAHPPHDFNHWRCAGSSRKNPGSGQMEKIQC
jgi:hypothetical protein